MQIFFIFLLFFTLLSCSPNNTEPSKELISEMNLKRGEVISCGAVDNQLGTLDFEISCTGKVREDFNLAMKLLHSFEYDEAEKAFSKVIDAEPGCAMAYWGIAMSNFHPLWAPPTETELKKGAKSIEIARGINKKTKREEKYIDAIASFYNDWDKVDHRSRCLKFEKAMEELYAAYPGDKEAAALYALSLTAAADPADKTYVKQKKAGNVLNSLYPSESNHPGIVHYIIHTFDSPELAEMALPAARKYASVAPSSAHALHMPSHIFTRLGLWTESIESNLASVASAKCYADSSGIQGHWDEELHGLDYLMYAYLQKGENDQAKNQLDYLNTINKVSPINFKVAYAFAAIPARYFLENKDWPAAARMEIKKEISWDNFPWQKAIIHFTRFMGAVHIRGFDSANAELKELHHLHDKLVAQKDDYKANQVQIQITTAEAWLDFKKGNNREALATMTLAADMEDRTEKHPVTPGEVLPARELLGDMLLQMNKPGEALEAYKLNLKRHPNRLNGMHGAGLAAQKSGDLGKAASYYQGLLAFIDPSSSRPELTEMNRFLKNQ